ncbi:MAG: MFS transporter [Myxococcales bacterium]|nr:MAG: MFS transporter [Myxococcales bacterium]
MSIPGQTMGVSVFTDPLLRATKLSRLQLSNAYLLGTILSGILLPWGGSALDRYGARLTATLSTFVLGLTLVVLSRIDRIAAFLGSVHAFFANQAFATGLLVVAFLCLRFSGQGMLTMTCRTTIGKWFDKRRGLVAGITGVVVSFGFASAPLFLNKWVTAHGWRSTWVEMAMVVAFGMGTLAWLLLRDSPEELGLQMDGQKTSLTENTSQKLVREVEQPEYTRAQALRTIVFWALTYAVALQGLVITGFTFHIVDIGADAGLDAHQAVAIFLPMAAVSTLMNLTTGYLSDRVRIRYLLMALAAFQCIGALGVTHFASFAGRAFCVLGFGAGGGMFTILTTVALPRFFGRKHLGAISGLQMMCIVIGSALGPSMFALARQLSGHYTPALLLCAALPLGHFILALLSNPPAPRHLER